MDIVAEKLDELTEKKSYGLSRFAFLKEGKRMMLTSSFIIASTYITSGLGFVYWTVAARLYSPAEVGPASAAVSLMMVISSVALSGVGSVVVSRLPGQRNSTVFLTAMLLAAGVSSIVIGGAFLGLSWLAPGQIGTFGDSLVFSVLLLLGVWSWTTGLVIRQALIASFRGALLALRDVIAALVKLLLLIILSSILFVPEPGATVFASWVFSSIAILVVDIQMLLPRAQPGYRPCWDLRQFWNIIRSNIRLALKNHAVSLGMSLPTVFVPIVVIWLVSPADYAYFYVAWMLANLLFIVPTAISQSLFAEGSAEPELLIPSVRTALILSGAIGTSGLILLWVTADWLLRLFGASYAENATILARLLGLSVLPMVIISVYEGTQRAKRTLRKASIVMAVGGSMTLIMVAIGGTVDGLRGTGMGWIAAQAILGLYLFPQVLRVLRSEKLDNQAAPRNSGKGVLFERKDDPTDNVASPFVN